VARLDPFDRPGEGVRRVGGEVSQYVDRARRLGLSFTQDIRLGQGVSVDVAAIRRGAFALSTEGDHLAYVAPDEDAMPAVLHWLVRHPAARCRLRISTPTAIRSALVEAGGKSLANVAVNSLAVCHPDHSARSVVTSSQLAWGIGLIALWALAFLIFPVATSIATNLVGAVLFFGVSALRFVAAGVAGGRPAITHAPPPRTQGNLPTYSILVPLYREAPLVGDLVSALEKLDWPRDRLDIKLLLEAGDLATIAAARRAAAGPPFEIVVVPPGGPRTKPRALSFALPLTRGDFVTVYDAEDRPHPCQLREAFATFLNAGPELAGLQSTLAVDNGEDSWLARLFAVEYAALFDGLLPALARLGMPVPLGGTSNHFRREALEAVGGWDPFNVTEDADLGLRLARFGYRCGTLDLPTLEEAPAELRPWLRQRTRWFKGWMQTWLVHMRHPRRLASELGLSGCIGFTVLGTGLIVSSLVYPVYLLTLAAFLTNPLSLWGDGGALAAVVVGVNVFNLVAGHLAMAVLSGRALKLRGRMGEVRGLILLPLYWLLMSLASYRAMLELAVRPHHWEKTAHRQRAGGWSRRSV
jgi:hypothetical protein